MRHFTLNDFARSLQVSAKERLEYLPGILGGFRMVALTLITEKTMGGFRIDFKLEILLMIKPRRTPFKYRADNDDPLLPRQPAQNFCGWSGDRLG